uniref:Putative permease of the major facilitator superfamily protein n=1 Tax=Lutzomyia longipalpis TaxID=7200 RepID=A0A1B0GKI7_LUTLO
MDLKHSNTMESTTSVETFVPNSKSTDLIKPPSASDDHLESQKPVSSEFRVYKRRWIVLAIFCLYSASNALQWIQYSIIANIIQRWFLDKMGLRIAAICGVLGTCLGAWIKVFSVHPDLFYVSFIGQSIVATSQVFILSLPARLAAVWFGPDQVSSACSIGVFGNQLGIAIGFVMPPILVRNHDDLDLVGRDIQFMFYLVAGFTSLLVILVLVFIRAKPPTPPSAAQEASMSRNPMQSSPFLHSIKRLMTNKNYILLLISYGVNIVLLHYPGHELDAGQIGLCIILLGMAGSVVSGIVLDKTHKFKETTLAVYALSMVCMWIYTFTLNSGYIWVVYLTSSLLGFFMTGYLPVGFEFAAELTFPEPEGTSAGILNAAAQVFGIIFTMGYAEILNSFGDIAANVTMATMLVVGTVVTAGN